MLNTFYHSPIISAWYSWRQITYLETINTLSQFNQRNIPVTTGQNVMVAKHTLVKCYRYSNNTAVGAVAAPSRRNVRN
jgi:hypothetical protein